MPSYPQISTARGVRYLCANAHESDFSNQYIDPIWAQSTATYQKMTYIMAWDSSFGGLGPKPSTVRSWSGAAGGAPRFVGYQNGILQSIAPSNGSIPDTAYARSANDPTKYLKDTTYLMLPSAQAWVSNRVNDAVSRYLDGPGYSSVDGWDGLYIDNLGWYPLLGTLDECDASGNLTGLQSVPYNPLTGTAFTKTEWMTGAVHLVETVAASFYRPSGNPLLFINGLGMGSRYFDATHPTSLLLTPATGGTFEIWLRSSITGVTSFKPESDWQLDLNGVLDVQSRTKVAQCIVKLWVNYTAAQHDQWHGYSAGSFLLVADGRSNLSFSDDSTRRITTNHTQGQIYHPEWDIDLGREIDTAVGNDVTTLKNGGLYRRRFTNGIVLVNPTASPVAVANLGGRYQATATAFGPTSPVTSVVVPANSGYILISA